MNKAGSAAKVKLNSFDDLFGASDMTAGTDQVQEIPLSELYEFKGHPFKVLDDEKMQETVESIRNYGVCFLSSIFPLKKRQNSLFPARDFPASWRVTFMHPGA